MKKQGIYCIENIISGKKYYGSSMNISKRFATHMSALKYNRHHCIHLQRAVTKYGINSFKFYIVEETSFQSKRELYDLEQKYIDVNIHGYNVGSAGGGDNLTNNPNKDDIIKRRTHTQKNNISFMTEEERKEKWGRPGESNPRYKDGSARKICPVCQVIEIAGGAKSCMKCQTYDRAGEKNSFFGKKHTEETINKLKQNVPWTKSAKPEDQPYTKKYEITYPDSSTKVVYGLKAIAIEFKSSIANVDYTIDRMKRKSLPTKRSRFYQHLIKEIR